MQLPKRKPTRLKNYDYSNDGAYFITICSYKKLHIFGTIKDGVIIGAGASGLFSAINMSNENYEITILEANDKPGKKILVTGNPLNNIQHPICSISIKYLS